MWARLPRLALLALLCGRASASFEDRHGVLVEEFLENLLNSAKTLSDGLVRASFAGSILNGTTGDAARFRDFAWPFIASADPERMSYIFAGFEDGMYLQYRSNGVNASRVVADAAVAGFDRYPVEAGLPGVYRSRKTSEANATVVYDFGIATAGACATFGLSQACEYVNSDDNCARYASVDYVTGAPEHVFACEGYTPVTRYWYVDGADGRAWTASYQEGTERGVDTVRALTRTPPPPRRASRLGEEEAQLSPPPPFSRGPARARAPSRRSSACATRRAA